MAKQELDNMWAELQLNVESASFRGKEYISICWTIDEDGKANALHVTETHDINEALRDFEANNIAANAMCKVYCFKRPVVYLCCALARFRYGCYMLIEQHTYNVKYATPMR